MNETKPIKITEKTKHLLDKEKSRRYLKDRPTYDQIISEAIQLKVKCKCKEK